MIFMRKQVGVVLENNPASNTAYLSPDPSQCSDLKVTSRLIPYNNREALSETPLPDHLDDFNSTGIRPRFPVSIGEFWVPSVREVQWYTCHICMAS